MNGSTGIYRKVGTCPKVSLYSILVYRVDEMCSTLDWERKGPEVEEGARLLEGM